MINFHSHSFSSNPLSQSFLLSPKKMPLPLSYPIIISRLHFYRSAQNCETRVSIWEYTNPLVLWVYTKHFAYIISFLAVTSKAFTKHDNEEMSFYSRSANDKFQQWQLFETSRILFFRLWVNCSHERVELSVFCKSADFVFSFVCFLWVHYRCVVFSRYLVTFSRRASAVVTTRLSKTAATARAAIRRSAVATRLSDSRGEEFKRIQTVSGYDDRLC